MGERCGRKEGGSIAWEYRSDGTIWFSFGLGLFVFAACPSVVHAGRKPIDKVSAFSILVKDAIKELEAKHGGDFYRQWVVGSHGKITLDTCASGC